MPLPRFQPLWERKASLFILLAASCGLLLLCLGARELWTQEHRWADIVSHMFYRHDFLHPWLNGQPYYDKPLLSYWLISGVVLLSGKLSVFALRLPSAIAGLVAIGAMYQLGTHLRNRDTGLLASWMLLTTFYFLFWARTSSADMLNMAGILCAVSWYFCRKNRPGFFTYLIFYLIVVFTSLCKGLIAPVVVGLVILPDLLMRGEWRQHCRGAVLLAAIPALLLYFLPFVASSQTGGATWQGDGLGLVWRENVVRYFQPFDHKGPIYTYLLYLPVYLLPWTLFFLPALFTFRKRLMSGAVLLIFVFLTLSGSRRNYYILPIVPFALLMTADWILAEGRDSLRYRIASWLAPLSFVSLFLALIILQPLYYQSRSLERFSATLRQQAEQIRPWSEWRIVLLDPQSKLRFYLGLPPDAPLHEIPGDDRAAMTTPRLKQAWPFLATASPAQPVLYVSRHAFQTSLSGILGSHYRQIGMTSRKPEPDQPVAFLPQDRL